MNIMMWWRGPRMSLKIVHAVFIAMSLLLGVFVMIWAWSAFRYYHHNAYLFAFLGVSVMEGVVVWYLKYYLKKARTW